MELRIKDLESELSKVKTLQEDSKKAELEKYKQLPKPLCWAFWASLQSRGKKKSHYFIYTFICYRKYSFIVSKYQIQPLKDENLPILSVL